jgi:O-antigen ligase
VSRAASARRDRRSTPPAAPRAASTAHTASAAPPPSVTGPERGAFLTIALLLIVTPLIVLTDQKEGFRLAQGLASGWLGLASLAIASLALRHAGRIDAADLWRRPALRALAPLLLVVAAGGFFTAHPAHFRAAFADFAIGVACLIGWSIALRETTLRRALAWTIPSATIVALLALDQFARELGSGLGLLDWLPISAPTARLRLTSTLGNPGDVASFLVLPTLIALSRLRAAGRNERVALAAALIVMLAAIAATATLAATAAVIAGGAVWWWMSSVRRGNPNAPPSRTMVLAIALLVIAGAATMVVSSPLRTRVAEKVGQLARGELNALLTGRIDGWRTAWAMLRREPITGVGQGAFRAEFVDTRLALEAQGVPFYGEQLHIVLSTPHNEALSVAAEQGLPGLAALAWALWCLGAAARRRRLPALAWSGLVALGLLACVSFPLHVAAVAWPWLLFLAWMFRLAEDAPAIPQVNAGVNA